MHSGLKFCWLYGLCWTKIHKCITLSEMVKTALLIYHIFAEFIVGEK